MIKVFDKFIFDSIESFGIKPLGSEWSWESEDSGKKHFKNI